MHLDQCFASAWLQQVHKGSVAAAVVVATVETVAATNHYQNLTHLCRFRWPKTMGLHSNNT